MNKTIRVQGRRQPGETTQMVVQRGRRSETKSFAVQIKEGLASGSYWRPREMGSVQTQENQLSWGCGG